MPSGQNSDKAIKNADENSERKHNSHSSHDSHSSSKPQRREGSLKNDSGIEVDSQNSELDAEESIFQSPDAFVPMNNEPKIVTGYQAPNKSISSDGKVYYLSGEALERPILPPKNVIRASYILIAIAAVIGVIFISVYLDGVFNGPAREKQMLEENIQREVDLGLPNLQTLVALDDASILAKLQESGATLYEKVPVGSESPFEVIKLPADVSLADAAALYLKGISSLSASEAALLLNGSWDLTVNREKGMNMGIHYADFKSGGIDRAISEAVHSQEFDTNGNIDSGEDSSGNTYISGAVDIDGNSYSWRVSAVPLSAVYSQQGLPEDAVYVGIRIYS